MCFQQLRQLRYAKMRKLKRAKRTCTARSCNIQHSSSKSAQVPNSHFTKKEQPQLYADLLTEIWCFFFKSLTAWSLRSAGGLDASEHSGCDIDACEQGAAVSLQWVAMYAQHISIRGRYLSLSLYFLRSCMYEMFGFFGVSRGNLVVAGED